MAGQAEYDNWLLCIDCAPYGYSMCSACTKAPAKVRSSIQAAPAGFAASSETVLFEAPPEPLPRSKGKQAGRQTKGTSASTPMPTATLDAYEQEQLEEAILAMGAQAAEAQAQIAWMAAKKNEGKVPPAIAKAARSQLPAVIGVLVATELGLREQLHESIVGGTHTESSGDGVCFTHAGGKCVAGGTSTGGTGAEPECAELRAAVDAARRGIEAAIAAYRQCCAAIPAERKLSPGMSAEQLQELLGNLALAGDMTGATHTDPEFEYDGDSGNVHSRTYRPASKIWAATGPTATDRAYAAFERARQEQVAVLTPQINVDVGLYDAALREAWAAAAADAAADADDADASGRIEGDGSTSAPSQRCPTGPELLTALRSCFAAHAPGSGSSDGDTCGWVSSNGTCVAKPESGHSNCARHSCPTPGCGHGKASTAEHCESCHAGCAIGGRGANPIPDTAAGLGYGPTDLRLIPHCRLEAAEAAPALFRKAAAIASRHGVRVKFGKLKKEPRLIFKTFSQKAGNFTAINDHGRLTFEAAELAELAAVRADMAADAGLEVIRDKMRLDPEEDRSAYGGYADCQTIVRVAGPNRHAMEVQASLVTLLRVKTAEVAGAGGHLVFEKARRLLVYAGETFSFRGAWSDDVGKKIAAGVLRVVVLVGAVDTAALAAAMGSATCRLASIDLSDMSSDLGMAARCALLDFARPPACTITGVKDLLACKQALQASKNAPEVVELNLAGCHVVDEDAGWLEAMLETNTTLTSLNLRSNKLGDAAGAAIGRALETNTTLTSLNLESNNLGEAACAAISQALETNTTLTSLNLEGNNLGDAAGAAFGRALETNTTLTSLNLKHNNLGLAVRCVLLDAARPACTVTVSNLEACKQALLASKNAPEVKDLNLTGCHVVDEDAGWLEAMLETNTTLTSLDLHNNHLGDAACAAISRALETNTTLTSLNLESNNLGKAGGAAIGRALETNTTLTSLHLDSNNLGEAAKQSIRAAWGDRLHDQLHCW